MLFKEDAFNIREMLGLYIITDLQLFLSHFATTVLLQQDFAVLSKSLNQSLQPNSTATLGSTELILQHIQIRWSVFLHIHIGCELAGLICLALGGFFTVQLGSIDAELADVLNVSVSFVLFLVCLLVQL